MQLDMAADVSLLPEFIQKPSEPIAPSTGVYNPEDV